MKHTSKAVRKESKKESTKIRHGYEKTFPGAKGKVLAKESKKEHKKTHEKFKSLGGTTHKKAYKAK